MKNLLISILSLFSFTLAIDLRTVPCKYLMPGEVIESSATENYRLCVINTYSDEKQISYLVHVIFIEYSHNTIMRFNWSVMPFCVMSQIGVFQDGNRTMYMVDTLTEGSWMKRLYRRTCD